MITPPVKVLKQGTGNEPGWVSGTLASLAISATATLVFDLGQDWAQYALAQINVKGTQAITSITAYGSDSATVTTTDRLLCATTGSALAMVLAAAGEVAATVLVSGRYIRIVIVNGGTAQASTAAVSVTQFPA